MKRIYARNKEAAAESTRATLRFVACTSPLPVRNLQHAVVSTVLFHPADTGGSHVIPFAYR